ncbi:MAG: DNA gyrase subunit A [Clostridiales bacterium]|nr:DNA gyrase subunit A [Clostridiales bacterium]
MDGTNQGDKIKVVNLEDEMRKSYINYAMSVIVARALPDVRDGLKPVHRRILFAMHELNLDPAKAYKKSARITGDTMGKYHPHGDVSIYDAMVRMAQDFSIRYPLVDGHGNFGSLDGDPPAAQRYTEARLSRIAMEMLRDIDKETVDFIPNYDGEFQEPTTMPSRFPNLLVNGSSGIAVGMATNIPPHNLSECIDAIVLTLDNSMQNHRETSLREILEVIQGPDLPTGGVILGSAGFRQAYQTGRGKMTIRGAAHIEPMSGASGREMIVVTEIPYQVNKARMFERMAELVKDKKIEGVTDMRDESDRNGIRIVVELRRDANAQVILNNFYKYSPLQESYSVIQLALVKNNQNKDEARILTLKQILDAYIAHQKDVVTRRTRFELNKAEKRAHILQGHLIALDHIDEVIAIIRSCPDAAAAKARLAERFDLSEEQAGAIVEMRLRALTGLEREKIEKEFAQIQELIRELRGILEDEDHLCQVIRDDLIAVKEKFGDLRKTQILDDDPGEIDIEDLIEEENSVITMTHLDYIKRIPLSAYKSQARGGKGVIGMQMREEDLMKNLFVANTHDRILFFTNQGRVFACKAYKIPEAGRTAKGIAIVNMLNLNSGEKIAAVIPVKDTEQSEYLVLLTKQGVIKKTALRHFAHSKQNGLIAINIKENDELITALRTDGSKEIFIVSNQGMGLRFRESDIRPMGRTAAGLLTIVLKAGDYVVGAGVVAENEQILLVTEHGMGKCVEIDSFRLQYRRGKGLRAYKITERTGNVLGVCSVNDREEVMLITSEGVVIRIRISEISVIGRNTQGVKLINLGEGVTAVSMAKIAEDQIEEDTDAGAENQIDGEDQIDADGKTDEEDKN